MEIKVCGMKYGANLVEVSEFQPDYMGFIFYPKSARYVGHDFPTDEFQQLNSAIKKVAVFVNEKPEIVDEIYANYAFDYVQLHGEESPEYCTNLRKKGVKLIKAFSVDHQFDFDQTEAYESSCAYFLFDTKGPAKGGNGVSFDWKLLHQYHNRTPFFLSGGIGSGNLAEVKKLKDLNMVGIDLNSKLEQSPGLKDINEVKRVFELLKEEK